MSAKFLGFLSLLIVGGATWADAPPADGLYPISSIVTDYASGKKFMDVGSMLIFTLPGTESGSAPRLIGLTDAHLTFGSALAVNGVPLTKGRLVKSELSLSSSDLHLYELDATQTQGKVSPMGHWDDRNQEIILDSGPLKHGLASQEVLPMTTGTSTFNTAFIPLGFWTKKNGEGFLQNNTQVSAHDGSRADTRFGLSYLPLTNELYTTSIAPAGASGSPLVQLEIFDPFSKPSGGTGGPAFDLGALTRSITSMNVRYVVHGLVKRASRSFPGTWFSSQASLASLIQAFKDGKTGEQYQAAWQYQNGLTYQNFQGGYSEVNHLRSPTGNLSRSDGGNLSRSDGGAVESVAPPFLSPSVRKLWDPTLWKKWGISPGVGSPAGPVIAYQLPSGEALYAEDDPFVLAKNLGIDRIQLKDVPLNTDFKKLFLDRFMARLDGQVQVIQSVLANMAQGHDPIALEWGYDLKRPEMDFSTYRKGFIDQLSEVLKKRQAALRLSRAARAGSDISLTLGSETKNEVFPSQLDPCSDAKNPESILLETLRLTSTGFHFELHGPLPEKDVIRFSLDLEGRLKGPKGPKNPFFLPVIEVLAQNTKTPYLVDLTSLFFVDPSRVRSDQWIIKPSEQMDLLPLTQNLVKNAGMEGPILRLKKMSDDQIFEIQLGSLTQGSASRAVASAPAIPCPGSIKSSGPVSSSVVSDLKAIQCKLRQN